MSQRRSHAVRRRVTTRRRLKTVANRPAGGGRASPLQRAWTQTAGRQA